MENVGGRMKLRTEHPHLYHLIEMAHYKSCSQESPLPPSKLINLKWLTKGADVFKRESYAIRVLKTFSFASQLPPFPSVSSFLITICPDLTATRWMYMGHTVVVLIRTDRCSNIPTVPPADQQNNTDSSEESWCVHVSLQQAGVHPVFTGRKMVSPQREASRFSLPGSIPSYHLPLTPPCPPPQYLWLSSMHRLNPFYPAAPLWHHMFFESEKDSNLKVKARFVHLNHRFCT